jgi:hypothetical protein
MQNIDDKAVFSIKYYTVKYFEQGRERQKPMCKHDGANMRLLI